MTHSNNNLKKDRHYKIKINLFGRIFEYSGKITYLEKEEFGLKIQEETCPLQFKIKDIVEIKELPEPKQENKVFKINSKKKFKDLKESVGPGF